MKKSLIGERDRRIVPRWRGFAASVDLTTGRRLVVPPPTGAVSDSFAQNQADWQEVPSLWNALDFIAGAIVEERMDLAVDAIEQVRKDSRLPTAGARLIDAAENRTSDIDLVSASTVEEESAKEIRKSRRRLAEHPWDAVEWMDLARSFTTLGLLAKASRCVGAAVKIAPTNRFIIRAASRFYVHSLEPERALWLLSRAGVMQDPWLMAPQVAISGIIGHGSAFARDGLKMLKQDFSASDLSELGAALGTLEVQNGKLVHAKKLLRQSLEGANENSVAQIEWLNRTRLGDVIDVSVANPPRLYEAGAWSSFVAGEWEESRRLAELWFRDQPFSGNAATVSSYILSEIAHDYPAALRILKTALRCNPNHPILVNNMAFAHIQSGHLQEAESLLGTLPDEGSPNIRTTARATRGLLEFRKGNLEDGRAIFLKVIEDFVAREERDQAGRAATQLALEELNSDTSFVTEAVQRSLKLTDGTKASNLIHKVQELEDAVERYVAKRKS